MNCFFENPIPKTDQDVFDQIKYHFKRLGLGYEWELNNTMGEKECLTLRESFISAEFFMRIGALQEIIQEGFAFGKE